MPPHPSPSLQTNVNHNFTYKVRTKVIFICFPTDILDIQLLIDFLHPFIHITLIPFKHTIPIILEQHNFTTLKICIKLFLFLCSLHLLWVLTSWDFGQINYYNSVGFVIDDFVAGSEAWVFQSNLKCGVAYINVEWLTDDISCCFASV